MTIRSFVFTFLASTVLVACSSDPLQVETDAINVSVRYVNLDSLLFKTSDNQLVKNHLSLLKDMGDIYQYELGACLSVPDASDTSLLKIVHEFKRNPFFMNSEKEIQIKFSSLSEYSDTLNSAWKHLKYHFPKEKLPKTVVFMNTFFLSNTFVTTNEVGIGLERYLGENSDVIKALPEEPFHDWMKAKMDARYLVRDVICNWVSTHYLSESKGNLAERMVFWGKALYITNAAIPNADPSILLRYTPKEYEWALANEYDMWTYLAKDKLLFKLDEKFAANLLNDAPFTAGLPVKGPDRLGQFIGYRMILKYMELHPDTKLKDLPAIDFSEILMEYEID